MSFLADLNPAQRDAVEAIDGPVMVVAGAGSGKTRVLTYRAAHLLSLGVRPESILALTFTNKAADEMKLRIRGLVGGASRHLWMGTFHSLFARILRTESEAIGYGKNFTIYDTDDSLALIKSVMNALGLSQQQYPPQGMRARISLAKNQLLTPRQYRESAFDTMTERTALVFEQYDKKLRAFNAMDFDDLLQKPLELFEEHPRVLERYQHRFKYLLVDEYQDTNRVQYRLIQKLAAHHRNICVVGDDAQSIYSFRGADIRNILEFERDYPDSKLFRLEQNYRSTQTILHAADSLLRHNRNQIPKKLWTQNAKGENAVLTVSGSDLEEGQRVVQQIEDESRREKRDLKDFAVLYRTNAQSRALEDALRRHGIPYVIVGGVAFYKRKEIKDVLAYMKVLVNPSDEESLLRIINVPARAIGGTTVERIRKRAQAEGLSLYESLGFQGLAELLGDRPLKAVRQFHSMIEKYRRLRAEMSASELVRALVDEIGFLRELKEENTPDSLARRENILELVSALSEYNDTHPGATLENFLEEVSLVSDVDMADFGHNAVTLMTIHAAKGLEFPTVFVTGLEEGLFPISGAVESPNELEEERRLMYVAMTRAMYRLYLSYAVTRYRFGDLAYSTRSRFLDEIDPSVITVTGDQRNGHARTSRRGFDSVEAPVHLSSQRRRKPADETAQYFTDTMPSYEEESQEPAAIRVGMRVVHASFGKGRIIALDGRGDNARAIVEFETVGRKHLMLKYAHLRVR